MKLEQIVTAMLVAGALWLPACATAAGTWVPLSNAPTASIGHFLLLPNGSVIAEDVDDEVTWYGLNPDTNGGYANGTWTTNAAMHYSRIDFSSDVLTNGNLFVAGGEYGTGTTNAELYNAISNTWTIIPVPAGLITINNNPQPPDYGNNAGFVDSISKILANGNVLIAPVDPATSGNTVIFNATSDTLSLGPSLASATGNQEEASWVKLPDDSIITIDPPNYDFNTDLWDIGGTSSERYIPALNMWVVDANVPVSLYDVYGGELGPGLLLTNGEAIFFGATTNTAIYTPSPLGGTHQGTWRAGPPFPNNQGMPDAPAAMLANGKILCVTEQAPADTTEWYPPISFYEFNYQSNNFTRVSAPGGGNTFNDTCWDTLLLDLPDGNVLFTHRSTDLYVYKTDGSPQAAGQPAIDSVTMNADGSLHLSGTLFNGISEGAAYGDDEQMDSNYPLVRFTDASNHVRYGRSHNWSRTSVATGSAIVTTECTLPAGASLNDTIQVVANGNASAGVHYPLFGGTTVYVDYSFSGTQLGTQSNPYNTIHTGVSKAAQGGIISIAGGDSTSGGDGHIRITTPVRIISTSGTASIGPN